LNNLADLKPMQQIFYLDYQGPIWSCFKKIRRRKILWHCPFNKVRLDVCSVLDH
jgi:hypothetical protein